jgi:hypothetical protein
MIDGRNIAHRATETPCNADATEDWQKMNREVLRMGRASNTGIQVAGQLRTGSRLLVRWLRIS